MKGSRRSFLKFCSKTAAALPFAVLFLNRNTAEAKTEVILTEDDPVAKALGYSKDATKVDTAKWPKRKGSEGEKQFCSNCMLLQGDAKEVSGQEGKFVGCQLFPGKLVSEKGWCNSWAAKQG
jgi:anaerobic selenocysteine-containing dehydrogenase